MTPDPSKTLTSGESQQTARGKRCGSRPWRPNDSFSALDVNHTLSNAVVRWAHRSGNQKERSLELQDVHVQFRRQKTRRLIVFLIDTSDSMGEGPEIRMSVALGAIFSLAKTAYLRRDQICLITFRERQADVVVPPTDSIIRMKALLAQLPVGGATPLAAGLAKAQLVISQAKRKNPGVAPLLVLISDGEATMPRTPGRDPSEDALCVARQLRQERTPALLIDTLPEYASKAFMPTLATVMNASVKKARNIKAEELIHLINTKEPDLP